VTDIQVKFAEKGVGYQCGKFESRISGLYRCMRF